MAADSSTNYKKIFASRVAHYKNLIDEDIKSYTKIIQKSVLNEFGAKSKIPIDAFLELLNRGGKRIRGALVMVGYEMMGGRDTAMILEAARAIEMIHTYLLIMDDIQDRSEYRRGSKTVHKNLSEYHHKHSYSGESDHFGIALSLNAMGIGNHMAQTIITNLDTKDSLKLRVLDKLNKSIVVTAYGQTNDIINEVNIETDVQDVNNVLEWKTAHYTILNPLAIGMTLAGAKESEIKMIREYSLQTGRAFQITDDILGTFGSEYESGKSPLDDIKEGKRTLLAVYALEHTNKADKNFLIQMLGNTNISLLEFNHCKDILINSGALNYANNEVKIAVAAAIKSIQSQKVHWQQDCVGFLIGLAQYISTRKS